MNLNKTTNSKYSQLFFFIIIIIFFIVAPRLLDFIETINLSSGCNNKTYIITADSLITTAIVTMIVFTNFAPNNSSGSSSIIRRTYWRSRLLTTDAKKIHITLWMFSLSFLVPSLIIVITLSTTIVEVFLLISNENLYWILGMLLITSFMMITSLCRFIIFHLYSNKNVAIWMVDKVKNNKEFLNSKSLYLDILSYFRITSNFKLVYVILKKFSNEKVSINKIIDKPLVKIKKRDIPKSTEGVMHPSKITDVLNEELLILNIFVFNLMSNRKIYRWDKKTNTVNEEWKILEKYLINFYEKKALDLLSILSFDEGYSFTKENPSSPSSAAAIKNLLKKPS